MGSAIDAAGVSVTTGSSTADTVLKWGFWIGMGLAAHRLYRVLRYDDPFIQWGGGTPAAWEMNPEDEDLTTVCAWCKRMRVGDRWVSDDPETDYITHGICPRCEQKMQREIEQYRAQHYEEPSVQREARRAPSWQPNPRRWEDLTTAEEAALKEELLDAYEPATNLSALARMFGVPVHAARQWLVESGKYIPSPMGGPRTITQLREAKERAEALHDRRQRPSDKEVLEARERLRAELIKEEMLKERERLKNELINAYQSRMNVRKLAKEKGVPYSTAMAWLKKDGVYDPAPSERSSEEFQREKFARFAIARPGEKVEDLATEFGIDRRTAFDWLHKEGVEIRAPEYIAKRQRGKWWKDSRSPEERELIDTAIALYKNGYSAKVIGKKLKVSISKVQSWLKIEGIYEYEKSYGGSRWSKKIGSLKAARTRRRRRKNPGPDEFARVCSWCKRMFVEGEWVPGEPETEWVTHGLCEQCEEQVLREIEEEEESERYR